ncbi:hypothetical protein FB468_0759 [Leucobacter komagatae]|uniref:Uncharacterized protein n=1 Tax=Leucobacter komagatae TaxID=55969 RepID=A0A542Y3V3_9MICO|nr:hypothetical protein [Leucobacter komagatae]TQL42754.1 hypothetical protein FB468_0759 [Leucobacter komagatae]
MTTRLTPYDTGDRLEPHPWPIVHTEPGGSAIDRDHYGYVDLDNDESATVFTIVGKRHDHNTADGSQGYLLSVSTYGDDSAVEIDGDRVLVLDEETLAGLDALVELARRSVLADLPRRGREDFVDRTRGPHDYSDEGIAVADDQWRRAQQAIKTIRGERP